MISFFASQSRALVTHAAHITGAVSQRRLLGTRTRSDNARPTPLSAASVKYRDKKIGISDWRECVLYLLINTQRRRTTFCMPRDIVRGYITLSVIAPPEKKTTWERGAVKLTGNRASVWKVNRAALMRR